MELTNLPLNFELGVGIYIDEKTEIKEIQLTKVNGVAEKLFMNRLPTKPFTWLAYIISLMVKEINGVNLSSECRSEYLKDGSIAIRNVVGAIPIAVASTLILEIHKRTWGVVANNQTCSCQFCREKFIADIDLDKVVYSEEDEAKLAEIDDFRQLVVELSNPFTYLVSSKNAKGQSPFEEFNGKEFSKLVFKCPTLQDAIRNEKIVGDEIGFWRKVGLDCLIEVTNEQGESLPVRALKVANDSFYNEMLDKKGLAQIRTMLRDFVPTLGFRYLVECPRCYNETYIGLAGNAIFSD